MQAPMADEIDGKLFQLVDDMACLCGIPGCKGHEAELEPPRTLARAIVRYCVDVCDLVTV